MELSLVGMDGLYAILGGSHGGMDESIAIMDSADEASVTTRERLSPDRFPPTTCAQETGSILLSA